MRRAGGTVVVLALFVACSDLKSAEEATSDDAGAPSPAPVVEAGAPSPAADGGGDDDDAGPPPAVDAGPVLPPNPDAGVGPELACEAITLGCYAPNTANVLDVPDEMTLSEAFSQAKAGDIIQMRAGYVDGTMLLPSNVTLHGCTGATVRGVLGFEGLGGVVEGMNVSGQILANTTGEYTIRKTYFVGPSSTPGPEAPGVVLSAASAASIKLTIAQSSFRRELGIAASAVTGAGLAGSALHVENCVFDSLDTAIDLSRTDTVAPLRAVVVSSTFYGFHTAIAVNGLTTDDASVDISASLFASGFDGVKSDALSGVRVGYSFAHAVLTPWTHAGVPNPFVDVVPGFVADQTLGVHDLRLAKGSAAVNRVPAAVTVPKKDIYGCPRPAGGATDPGAYESQPP